MSVSNIIMYLLPIIVTPILTRLYTPSAFGEWGVFSSFITIASISIFFGFENIIIQAQEKQLRYALSLCILTSIGTVALIGILFFIGRLCDVSFFTTFPAPAILFVYFIAYILYTVCYNLCNRYEQYYTLSFSNIVQGGTQAIFRILFAFICFESINGLILGTTIAQGVTAAFLLLFAVKVLSDRHISPSFQFSKIKELVARYKNVRRRWLSVN